MLTKTQNSGLLFSSGLLMAFITIFPINRSEAQMRFAALPQIDMAQMDMANTKRQLLNREIYPEKNTRPVERPGPQKPKKPVIAHYVTDGL